MSLNLEFKRLESQDIQDLTKYYEQRHDQTCDSMIFDNFLWREYYDVRFAVVDERAILWRMTIQGKDYAALPVCRMEDMPHYFDLLTQYFNEVLNTPLVIYLADEPAVEYLKLPKDQFLVEELPDSRDYLYEAEAMKNLSGKKLRKKKGHINAFMREYEGRFEYRTLQCCDRQDVWTFLDKWRERKGEEVEGHLDYEVEGIHEILKNCSDFRVRMGGIYVDGQMEAFSIGSYNSYEKMAIIHIEKANPEITGMYQLINQQFLIHEFPDAVLVNREDDMGLPGLRQAKESYAPVDFARKFRITQLWNR